MKKIFFILILLTVCLYAHSQTWEEWTQQKKTAIKRLVQQIAANKAYMEFARKGYSIVRDGLHAIRAIKKGDLLQHLGFMDSLQVVNPTIKAWTKLAAILTLSTDLVNTTKQAYTAARESRQFSPAELDYCKNVFDNLLEECAKNMDALLAVIRSGELSLHDDERILFINKLYVVLQEQFSFVASFASELHLLAIQRLSDHTTIDYSRKINGYTPHP